MDSPFNRRGMTRRTPPPTPQPQPQPQQQPAQDDFCSTNEIKKWMSDITICLNEVCSIAAEGKLNSDQKLKINKLCRNIGHGTSQLAVEYESVKHKTVQAFAKIEALKEKLDISKKLCEIKSTIEQNCSRPPSEIVSFADIVRKNSDTMIRPSNLSSIPIYPTDKLKTSEDTKTLVQKLISPDQIKLHVRGVRKTRNGGVIISTETKTDVEKLKCSSQLSSSGLTIEEPTKRNPRVIVIGVPTSPSDKEFFECLFEQNLADKLPNSSQTTIMPSIRLSHKSGKKDSSTCSFIIEVPAHIRKVLLNQQRVYMNWSSHPVRDFTTVTRCYKCQQYGHAAKTCRESAPACSHCGELGHAVNDCTRKDVKPKCATCLRFNKPSDHKTGVIECPARKMAGSRYINSIDYVGV